MPKKKKKKSTESGEQRSEKLLMNKKGEHECCSLSSSSDESVSFAIQSDDHSHLRTLSPAVGGYHATASATPDVLRSPQRLLEGMSEQWPITISSCAHELGYTWIH